MLPVNCGSHADYQNFVVTNLRKYYPNPDSLAKSTWDIIERFWNLDLSKTDTILVDKYSKFGPAPRTPSCMQRSYLLSIDFTDCKCDRYFSQPDCDIGWDSSRDCFYHGYDLYMLVDSQSDLPVFPHYSCASKHDSHGFLHAFFRMKSFLPDFKVSKVLLDSAHDAMPYYQYFKRENITPFIDLNGKGGRPPVYKNDFTIDKDGVPICPCGFRMRRDGIEVAKGRMKFKCPKISKKNGCLSCTCESPCSDAKYGRTVHLVMNDNPRLFNNPPRSSKEWKLEYNARTSAERSNKREKLDFKLEDGRHRSTKMWYCRLYHILMLQHLDAWDLPSESPLRKMILDVA